MGEIGAVRKRSRYETGPHDSSLCTEAPCAQASTAVRSALRAGYWPTCLTDGHMVVNDHTRSAENWKCVWYFLRPIDGSRACAKRRYTPINVAASQCFEWTEWGACRADCGVYYCCFQCCSFTLFRMDRVGACRADCRVYYCCFQCSSFAVLRMDRVYNIIYIYRVYVDSHSLGQLALASKRIS